MGEIALTSAYFHLRADGTYLAWNCSAIKQDDGQWQITPSEPCVNKLYTNANMQVDKSVSIIKIR
jgi:hypothetical protein